MHGTAMLGRMNVAITEDVLGEEQADQHEKDYLYLL